MAGYDFDMDSFMEYIPPEGIFWSFRPDGMSQGLLDEIKGLMERSGFDNARFREARKRSDALFRKMVGGDLGRDTLKEKASLEREIYGMLKPVFDGALELGYERHTLQRQRKEVLPMVYASRRG